MIDPHTRTPIRDVGSVHAWLARRGGQGDFADTGRFAARRAARNGNQREDADVT